jgi:hypothetical protein
LGGAVSKRFARRLILPTRAHLRNSGKFPAPYFIASAGAPISADCDVEPEMVATSGFGRTGSGELLRRTIHLSSLGSANAVAINHCVSKHAPPIEFA